jgi:glyoxylase-like metal-dependent hydrolase (beta-lactamase superfamily II)
MLMDGRTPSVLRRGRLCCHCLLIEAGDRLVLVDTGFGLRDVADPKTRLSGFFLTLLSPDFREERTAVRQIERLGFDPVDVTDIILTHLDFDHAGGLDDFPHAAVHMLKAERDHATARPTWLDKQRYRPQQWHFRERWQVYEATAGERWLGFDCVRDLAGLPPEILLVPLPGHTHGHAGVAVRTGGRWLLQAGDAYFWHEEMDAERPRCTPGLAMYQTLMEKDRRQRLETQSRLRRLRQEQGGEVQLVCAHDPIEFEQIVAAGRPAGARRGAVEMVA